MTMRILIKNEEGRDFMKEKVQYDCAGNLMEEITEVENLISQENEFAEAASYTLNCTHFLTILCC